MHLADEGDFMGLCCGRHGGGYLLLTTALGITSGREKGALIEAIGTFEKRTIERSIWLGPCQSRKRGWCFAYSSGRRQRRVDREKDLGPKEAGA